MIEVWAEWANGSKECIDTAESESEALYLVQEHKLAYDGHVKRVWIKQTDGR